MTGSSIWFPQTICLMSMAKTDWKEVHSEFSRANCLNYYAIMCEYFFTSSCTCVQVKKSDLSRCCFLLHSDYITNFLTGCSFATSFICMLELTHTANIIAVCFKFLSAKFLHALLHTHICILSCVWTAVNCQQQND